jgi:hypothetical protein
MTINIINLSEAVYTCGLEAAFSERNPLDQAPVIRERTSN